MVEKDNQLPLSKQCELLNINRATYYYIPKGENAKNILLMNRLDELHTAHPTWGSRKLRDALKLEGVVTNRKRIQRLMRILDIVAIYQSKNLSKRHQEHVIYPYLLRNVKITRVNQVWSTDITYIRLEKGWCYLTAIIDWHSRAILSWRISKRCNRFFCIDALKEALEKYENPEVFNTDQGATFTSPDFTGVLKNAKVSISMDGKGRALDNVYIERFWRTLKYDEVYLKSYANIEQAEKQIDDYIFSYNYRRPHAALDGNVPMNVYNNGIVGLCVAA